MIAFLGPIVTMFARAIPELIKGVGAVAGDRQILAGLRGVVGSARLGTASAERIAKAANLPPVGSAAARALLKQNPQAFLPQQNFERAKTYLAEQEKLLAEASEGASKKLEELRKNAALTGVEFTGMTLAGRHFTAELERQISERARFDAGTSKQVALLQRDRINRERDLAQSTAATSKAFLRMKNSAEEAMEPWNRFLTNVGNIVGSALEGVKFLTGKALGAIVNDINVSEKEQQEGAKEFIKKWAKPGAIEAERQRLITEGIEEFGESPEEAKKQADRQIAVLKKDLDDARAMATGIPKNADVIGGMVAELAGRPMTGARPQPERNPPPAQHPNTRRRPPIPHPN